METEQRNELHMRPSSDAAAGRSSGATRPIDFDLRQMEAGIS